MNIDAYKAALKRYDKALMTGVVAALCVTFASLGIAVFLRYLYGDPAEIVAPVIMFSGFLLMLYGFYRVDRISYRFPALICPHCHETLAKQRAVVVATGNCPNCGRNVLDDPTIGT